MYVTIKTMDVETWKKHFTLMAEGKLRPNHKGHYIVHNKQKGDGVKEPEIKWVTPLAQDIELAKSELNEDKKQKCELQGYKRAQKRLCEPKSNKRVPNPYKKTKYSGYEDKTFK